MDAADIEALRDAIRRQHGVESRWVESVRVTEIQQGGEIIFHGDVHVFDLDDHPTAKRAYAWREPGVNPTLVAVLELGPVTDPVAAVRAAARAR